MPESKQAALLRQYPGQHKNSKAKELLDRIAEGEEKSRSEWATELNSSPENITKLVGYLRKKGFLIHSVESNGRQVYKLILDSEDFSRQGTHDYHHTQVAPRVRYQIEMIEQVLLQYPALVNDIEENVNDLMIAMSKAKNNVIKLKRIHEHTTTTSLPDQAR